MPTPLMSMPFNPISRGGNRRENQLPGNIQNNEEGYTRTVDPNELTSTHLTDMTAGNSRYIRNARGTGTQVAASRGLANSSLAAANSEAAAIGAALPIASEDAGAYRTAASENLQSLAGQRIANEGNATSVANNIFSNNTQAGIAQNALDFNRERDRYTRGWQVEDQGRDDRNRVQERGWDVEDRDYGERALQRRNREGLAATTISTIFQNPEYFRDPQGAAGTIQFYQDMWNELFPNDGGTP